MKANISQLYIATTVFLILHSVSIDAAEKPQPAYNRSLLSSFYYYNQIQKNNSTKVTTIEEYAWSILGVNPNIVNNGSYRHYNFVFGFSTGHVGTHTFSEPKLYGPNVTKKVMFGFEGKATANLIRWCYLGRIYCVHLSSITTTNLTFYYHNLLL